MQIAACQPVSFCLEYNLRQDEHAVTGNTVHLNSWQSVSRRCVRDRRTSGRRVAPTTDMAAVLSRLSRDRLICYRDTDNRQRQRSSPSSKSGMPRVWTAPSWQELFSRMQIGRCARVFGLSARLT